MNGKFSLEKLFETLMPFIIAGTAIALVIGLLVMFSYILVWGLIIGGVLWLGATVKQYLFSSNSSKTDVIKKNQGRIIEHEDKK